MPGVSTNRARSVGDSSPRRSEAYWSTWPTTPSATWARQLRRARLFAGCGRIGKGIDNSRSIRFGVTCRMPRPNFHYCEKKGEFLVAVIGIRMIVTPLPIFGLFFPGCLFEVMFLQ